MYLMHGVEAHLGALVLNWKCGDFDVHGVDGNGSSLTLEDLQQLCHDNEGKPDIDVQPFVVWPENSNGHPEVAFYPLGYIEIQLEVAE